MSKLLICILILELAMQSGCALLGGGGAGPSIQHAKGYKVTPPKNWTTTDEGEGDRAYKLSSGSLATLLSSCNRDPQASLELLTKHLLIGAREIEYRRQNKLKIGAAEGLYSSVQATMDGVSVELDLFVLRKNGCVFDFSLMNPKRLSDNDRDEFSTFIRSLQFE
ncbi:MAG: hypothetical protein HY537_10650 [Deltaproteobacteria bacterium]|nr:hypothetical protein [Deltaproteobacteria bacterium]